MNDKSSLDFKIALLEKKQKELEDINNELRKSLYKYTHPPQPILIKLYEFGNILLNTKFTNSKISGGPYDCWGGPIINNEVSFQYHYYSNNDKIQNSVNVNIRDKKIIVIHNNDYKNILLDPTNWIHEPAILLYKMIDSDAKNYCKLDRTIFKYVIPEYMSQ